MFEDLVIRPCDPGNYATLVHPSGVLWVRMAAGCSSSGVDYKYFGSLSHRGNKIPSIASSQWHSSCATVKQTDNVAYSFWNIVKQTWLCVLLTLSMPNYVIHFLTSGSGAKPGFAKIFRRGAMCHNKSLMHAMHKVHNFPFQSFAVCVSVLFLLSHPDTKGILCPVWPWCNTTQCSWSKNQPWIKFHSLIQTHCTVQCSIRTSLQQ